MAVSITRPLYFYAYIPSSGQFEMLGMSTFSNSTFSVCCLPDARLPTVLFWEIKCRIHQTPMSFKKGKVLHFLKKEHGKAVADSVRERFSHVKASKVVISVKLIKGKADKYKIPSES